MAKSKRRPQASKADRVRNEDMGKAFIELRQGSRTSPHRNRAKYERNDFRREAQRGFVY